MTLDQDVVTIIVAIIAALGTYLAASRKIKREAEVAHGMNIYQEIDKLRERNERLVKDNERLYREISDLQARLKVMEFTLTTKVELFESAHMDLPFPMWLKNEIGIYMSVNDSYVQNVLAPRDLDRDAIIGKNDIEVFGGEAGTELFDIDQHVLETGERWDGIEWIPQPDGRGMEKWRVIKFVRHAKGVKLGIAGIAIKKLDD